MDCSSGNNVLAIALRDRVCLWDASNGFDSELFSVDAKTGPITSVSWAPNGQHIAVGMNNSIVELWDMTSNHKLRTLQGGHRARVGSLSWNEHILTIGAKDSMIIDNDSPDSCMVASRAGDETLRIWNVFDTPEVAKLTTGTTCAGPFSYLNDIR
ncbi:hypothetical protein AAC387_Pa02g2083 [Persea americana]